MDPYVTSVNRSYFEHLVPMYLLSIQVPPTYTSSILNCIVETLPIELGAWPLSIILGNLISPDVVPISVL